MRWIVLLQIVIFMGCARPGTEQQILMQLESLEVINPDQQIPDHDLAFIVKCKDAGVEVIEHEGDLIMWWIVQFKVRSVIKGSGESELIVKVQDINSLMVGEIYELYLVRDKIMEGEVDHYKAVAKEID